MENAEVNGLILLVEDDKMNQLVGSKVLSKLGFEFRIASHGGEAVAAVKRERYDAILMDCQMPEMDGLRGHDRDPTDRRGVPCVRRSSR